MSYGIRKTKYTDGARELHFLQSSDLGYKVAFDFLPWGEGQETQLFIGMSSDDGNKLEAGEYLTLEDARALRDWLCEILP